MLRWKREDGRWKKKTFYNKTSRIPASLTFVAKCGGFLGHKMEHGESRNQKERWKMGALSCTWLR
jgi:hypothetical protein